VIEQQIGWASEGKTKIALPNLGTERSVAGSLSPPGMSGGSSPPSFTATRPSYSASTKNRWVAVAGSVGLVVIVALLITRWTAGPSVSASSAAASAASIAAAKITPPPAVEAPSRPTVTLTIRVTPSKALVQLDGASLPTNPFHSAVPKDATLHKLTASAPGFTTEERLLQYDQDAIIDLVLKRGVGRPGPPAAAVDPAAAPGTDLKKTTRPKHSVDEEDPYQ
jgi:hypothetical protein